MGLKLLLRKCPKENTDARDTIQDLYDMIQSSDPDPDAMEEIRDLIRGT